MKKTPFKSATKGKRLAIRDQVKVLMQKNQIRSFQSKAKRHKNPKNCKERFSKIKAKQQFPQQIEHCHQL
jgi:hypothetical protein